MNAICPRCGHPYTGFPAMSRFVTAEICSDCGLDEAMRSFLGAPPMAYDCWYEDPRGRQ